MSLRVKNTMLSFFVCVALQAATGITALAAEIPNAGKILEQNKRPDTTVQKPVAETPLQVDQPLRPPLAGGSDVKILVTRFHITGQDVFSEAELLPLLADSCGKELTLAQIEGLSSRIADYFHKHGYIMAGAYVPEQQIQNGVVELSVVVGRYDQIVFRKKAAISDNDLNLQLGKVQTGAYIKKDNLEQAIWLLNDLAGVEAKATLGAGSKPGTANLYLDILPKSKTVLGDVGIDNYGNRFTGKNELFADIIVNNPFQQGDQFVINGVETNGNGLTNGGISYSLPLFTAGGKLSVGYSRLRYALGDEYTVLNANGTADAANLTYTYTFHRSRQSNLYGSVGYVAKRLEDNVYGVATDKKSHSVVIGLNGDSLDAWGGGGSNTYSLFYSGGHLSFQSPDALAIDNTTAQTNGAFDKFTLAAERHQYLNNRLTLVASLHAQLADHNLDSSEQMSLGGAYGVRAYPQGEASGDEGILFNSELRWSIPTKSKNADLLQLVGFFDAGSTTLHKDPWAGFGTVNHRTLEGAGLGAVWNNPGILTLKAYYAWKIGNESAVSDRDRNGRLWVQCISYF